MAAVDKTLQQNYSMETILALYAQSFQVIQTNIQESFYFSI